MESPHQRPPGAVVPFPSGRDRRTAATGSAGPARILLFTGVRYERWTGDESSRGADFADPHAQRRRR